MIATIGWFLGLALEIGGILIGFWILGCVLNPRRRRWLIGLFEEMLMGIKDWFKSFKEEKEEPAEEKKEEERIQVEMTFEEFEKFKKALKEDTPKS